ncbi:Protein HGH1 homolog [Gryllus bimaculatus]|nr:Protein HGH1 homolog [Gryllus bimaculatus]
MDELTEMLNYLDVRSRLDLKTISLQYVLGVTGSEDGKLFIVSRPPLVKTVLALLHDPSASVAKDAFLCIVNLSAEEAGARVLVSEDCCSGSEEIGEKGMKSANIVASVLSHIVDPESSLADPACAILSNITRPSCTVQRVLDLISQTDVTIEKLVTVFTRIGYNKKGATLHYLGPVFSNLSQSSTFRSYLLDRGQCVIQRLVPFTEYKDSIIRRGGIVGTLRNCCFDVASHMWLLGPDVDILPRLLLPLAGSEEFDEEDNEKLPPELQYLSPDKNREPDPDIRRMLLEALLQTCYPVVTEDEIGQDNLQDVDVPDDLRNRFHKMDEDFLRD